MESRRAFFFAFWIFLGISFLLQSIIFQISIMEGKQLDGSKEEVKVMMVKITEIKSAIIQELLRVGIENCKREDALGRCFGFPHRRPNTVNNENNDASDNRWANIKNLKFTMRDTSEPPETENAPKQKKHGKKLNGIHTLRDLAELNKRTDDDTFEQSLKLEKIEQGKIGAGETLWAKDKNLGLVELEKSSPEAANNWNTPTDTKQSPELDKINVAGKIFWAKDKNLALLKPGSMIHSKQSKTPKEDKAEGVGSKLKNLGREESKLTTSMPAAAQALGLLTQKGHGLKLKKDELEPMVESHDQANQDEMSGKHAVNELRAKIKPLGLEKMKPLFSESEKSPRPKKQKNKEQRNQGLVKQVEMAIDKASELWTKVMGSVFQGPEELKVESAIKSATIKELEVTERQSDVEKNETPPNSAANQLLSNLGHGKQEVTTQEEEFLDFDE